MKTLCMAVALLGLWVAGCTEAPTKPAAPATPAASTGKPAAEEKAEGAAEKPAEGDEAKPEGKAE